MRKQQNVSEQFVSLLIFKLGTFQKEGISIVTIYTTAIRCCEQEIIDFYSKKCVIAPVVVVEHCALLCFPERRMAS